MRKYYQAALAVTAVVSLVSLLIYRHEYNRLRYVLEVFNYFGKPWPRRTENCSNFYRPFAALDAKFDEPIPSWQRLEDDLYVYSAYSINDMEVRAVGLGTVNGVANVQCLVFFENEGKPILGSFRFIPIGSAITSKKAGKYKGYHFVCTHTSNETPTGVTFVTKSNKYLNYAPIFPIKVQPRSGKNSQNRIGMCVMQEASTRPMRPLDMVGFISFHALGRMDNFIVYDSGISNEFNVKLREMAGDFTSPWRFTYTVVPWNFPFTELDPSVIREILEVDCLYRTHNNVGYAVTLAWNEYVILKYHRAMIDLLADFKRSKLAADRYRLKTAVFCTQQADDRRHGNLTLTVLRKTKSDDASVVGEYPVYVHKPHVTLLNTRMYTREIGRDLAVMNRYKYCDNYKDGQGTEDPSILRFAQDIQNSSILRKYLGLYDIDIK
ncbi:hypothetical protein DMN91_008048 [Ooceraea biroi]|uniref:Glycosyltransferase family 92 protein n=1 Tax=Ooceraea biroi TaxID=2015173 RepID=A0A026X0H5_OOCBI|nr:uncharacterized protein LOC105287856 [Ooceraea biroi]EZA60899.1 hypothetical protein X777_13101 [Ooceraea biroi]RLU19491.1 hypothetical protein DMN91_008048 [Ooceraea biroi]